MCACISCRCRRTNQASLYRSPTAPLFRHRFALPQCVAGPCCAISVNTAQHIWRGVAIMHGVLWPASIAALQVQQQQQAASALRWKLVALARACQQRFGASIPLFQVGVAVSGAWGACTPITSLRAHPQWPFAMCTFPARHGSHTPRPSRRRLWEEKQQLHPQISCAWSASRG